MTDQSTEQLVTELSTISDFVRFGASAFNQAGLYFGHGTDNAWDESVFLTMFAGGIGIILGAGVLSLINNLTKDVNFPYTNPTVPIPYVLGALAIMIILGTLIGSIPGQRAVSIKPIDALREE